MLIIEGPIARGDIPFWCERIRHLVEASGAHSPVICDVTDLGHADVDSVDGLARMQLTARRLGAEIRLRGASERLCALLALVGLAEVIPLCRRQARGQASAPDDERRPNPGERSNPG